MKAGQMQVPSLAVEFSPRSWAHKTAITFQPVVPRNPARRLPQAPVLGVPSSCWLETKCGLWSSNQNCSFQYSLQCLYHLPPFLSPSECHSLQANLNVLHPRSSRKVFSSFFFNLCPVECLFFFNFYISWAFEIVYLSPKKKMTNT